MKNNILIGVIMLLSPVGVFAQATSTPVDLEGVVGYQKVLNYRPEPYILGKVEVVSGGKLTIEAGVTIKMLAQQGIFLNGGDMDVNGTKDKPIKITSIIDDGMNPIVDNVFSATSSRHMGIYISRTSGSSLNIYNTEIHYGGWFGFDPNVLITSSAIVNSGGMVNADGLKIVNSGRNGFLQSKGTTTITNSYIEGSAAAAEILEGYLKVSNSTFKGTDCASTFYCYVGFGSTIGSVSDVSNNWWGSATGPLHEQENPDGKGAKINGNTVFKPWLLEPPKDEVENQINPVIIIPGIMGSAKKNGKLVIDPILHTYDDLVKTFSENGFTEGKDLFTFPYEWRDSNVFSANLLDDKISEIKKICNCNKVDIVAHSMGGLVARSYIQSGDYDNDVDQVIFLGTPHRGSPKAYLQWEAGEFPSGGSNPLIETFFKAEAKRKGYSSIYDYIRFKPILSVQELLPIEDYIKDYETDILRDYPDNYPRNNFLENLDKGLYGLLLQRVKVINVVGDSKEDKTIDSISVLPGTTRIDKRLWQHGEPKNFYLITSGYKGLNFDSGDDTVPLWSTIINNIMFINHEVKSSHDKLPTVYAPEIYYSLVGKMPEKKFNDGTDLDTKVMIVQLLSPIDMVVTSPDGKKIGKNFVSGGEYKEIPGAFYSGYNTDEEYITIPNPLDGEYKIEVKGTDNGGEYGVLTSYVSEEMSITTEVGGVTNKDQITSLIIKVDNSNPNNLETEKKVTLDTLIADINKSYDLGWITDKKFRDLLLMRVKMIVRIEKIKIIVEEKLPNGKKKQKVLERLETLADKKLTKALLIDLKGYNKSKINEKGYNIIKSDLEYLLNN